MAINSKSGSRSLLSGEELWRVKKGQLEQIYRKIAINPLAGRFGVLAKLDKTGVGNVTNDSLPADPIQSQTDMVTADDSLLPLPKL
ncbi:hypothetical protein AMTR_s00050p00192510 [Amborella trichopoda]|uniref:Uncharacterized protein n=1 Tax=Amborella trichopoda TaxID=13333 RepID=W1PZA6_AMBTC|nr:hypothetical protein AMTR_s00050p00192510 [Amborella trichopoda]